MRGPPDLPRTEEPPLPPAPSTKPTLRWLAVGLVRALLGLGTWLVLSDSPVYRLWLRLSTDPEYLRDTPRRAGMLAPEIFVPLQALEVVMAPIPGEATGVLGGIGFGEGLGFVYSTAGLALRSMLAFAGRRWLGAAVVRRHVSKVVWDRREFLIRTRGAEICLLVFVSA